MQDTLTISKKILLLPYLPSFVFLGAALCDILFFNKLLLSVLPADIKSLFFYYIFFELPHIIASFFMFAEKEYRLAYKEVLYSKLLILTAAGIALFAFSQSLFYVIMVAYTLYHVVRQQFGIAKFYGMSEGRLLNTILVTSVAVGSVAFLSTAVQIKESLLEGASILGLLATLTFLVIGKEERKNIYLLLFMLSFGCSAVLFGLGYILLGLLSMRIVHDITAFVFYGTHNHNRRKDGANVLFRLFPLNKVSPYFLTIAFAIIFNLCYIYLVYSFKDSLTISMILTGVYYIISITHYYIEGKIWKKGTLARTYIKLS